MALAAIKEIYFSILFLFYIQEIHVGKPIKLQIKKSGLTNDSVCFILMERLILAVKHCVHHVLLSEYYSPRSADHFQHQNVVAYNNLKMKTSSPYPVSRFLWKKNPDLNLEGLIIFSIKLLWSILIQTRRQANHILRLVCCGKKMSRFRSNRL